MKTALSLLHLTALVAVFVAVSTLMATAQITPANGTVYVREDGSGDGSSWRDATSDLHSAIHASGVRWVFVAIGNYKVGDHSFVMKNGVAIYGGFDPGSGITDLSHARVIPSGADGSPEGSVLDGENTRPVIYNSFDYQHKLDNAILDGFTIKRGYSENGDGGGMYNGWASPLIRNCVFTDNKALRGGAIANAPGADVEARNCIFKSNEAREGGAIFNSSWNYPRFTNCTFRENKATLRGGAIASISFSLINVANSTFEGNTAVESGGAMYTHESKIDLKNNNFTDNKAKKGGAMYNASSTNDLPIIHCNFTGNRADGEGDSGHGGAMYNDGSHLIVTSCHFKDNRADKGGGIFNNASSPPLTLCVFTANRTSYDGAGMYITGSSSPVISRCVFNDNRTDAVGGGGIANYGGSPRIINSIFYNNVATGDGGGILNGSGQPFIYNSLFQVNRANFGGAVYNAINNTFTTIHNSIIQNNSSGVFDWHGVNSSFIAHSLIQGLPTGPDDNINGFTDASFVNLNDPIGPDGIWGTADDGFRLKISSILRNRGSNTAYEEADGNNGNNSLQNDSDFAGRLRLAYGTIDIGPYEFEIIHGGNKIVYVKTVATGATTGESWEDATDDLQGAIHARGTEMVFVAKGTYAATAESFTMKNGVAVYGGFDPENSITDLTHNRIMPGATPSTGEDGSPEPASGAVEGSVLSGNNERPVIINDFTAADPLTTSALLDGFTLTGGYSVAGGGAMFNHHASPLLRYLSITGNTGVCAIYNNASSPILTNVSITSNNGMGIYQISHTNPSVLTNVTLAGNSGGAFSAQAPLTLYNSIAFGGVDGTFTAHYSLIRYQSDVSNHNVDGWLTPEQVFANPSAGDYTLLNTSPAINKGSNALFPDLGAQSRDLAGNPRIHEPDNGGRIDLGAFESPYRIMLIPDAGGIVYVRKGYDGNGSSWEEATRHLQDAIDVEAPHKVFVASGIYGVGAHSFIMKNNVEIYGGFDPERGIRDLTHDRIMPDPGSDAGSVLDGEGERPVIYNMFDSEANGINRSALLDGFTITNGLHAGGAGIRNWYASPRLNNLVIRHNKATSLGAGVYNNYNSKPLITNTVIHSNEVEGTNIYGAGIYNSNGSAPEIINVTIAGNKLITTGSAKGAGMYSYNASAKVYNSIFRNNRKMSSTDVEGADIENDWSDITLKNSMTQVYPAGNSEDNNKVGADPLFTNEAAGDYTLKSGSPAINTGSNTLYLTQDAGPGDLAGNPRLIGSAIDMGAYENPDGVLPVRWISFKGYLNEQRQAVLTWKTEETNVSHYEVERSANARDFRIAGKVAAGGTGSGNYSLTDPAPVSGTVYYRIRQVDTDGTFSYSQIISLASAGRNYVFAYPNPARDKVTVELDDAYIGSTVSLINLTGTTLEQLQVEQTTLNLNMQKYAPGIYLLQMPDGKVLKLIRE